MSKSEDSLPPRQNSFNIICRETAAEFLGTTVLMVFGLGSVAQFVLSGGQTGSTDQVRWSWGLGVTFGVYVAGGVSGGHLNPAVTLTLCLFKRTTWNRLLPYWAGQYLGAFFASSLVYAVYYDALSAFKGGNRTLETSSIFTTYPQSYLSVGNGLGDQMFGTALLMLLVLALGDPKNMAPQKGFVPLVVGLIVVAIGMTFSPYNCGYAINPARDLSPRIFVFMAGWGRRRFSGRLGR
ncbi:Aquaporin-10 [Bulinus truncatus]|nr:Aquaporin-10 [Bulinus truncatus]